MICNLGHAALGGRFVRLYDDVGGSEVVSDLAVRYKVALPDHHAFKSQFFLQFKVFLRSAVELTGNYQFYVHLAETAVGVCPEQQVKSFVVADKAEEQHVTLSKVQSKELQRLLA